MILKIFPTILIATTSFFLCYSISCTLIFLKGESDDLLQSVRRMERDNGRSISNDGDAANDGGKQTPHYDEQHKQQQLSIMDTKTPPSSSASNQIIDRETVLLSSCNDESVPNSSTNTTTNEQEMRFQKETAVVISTHLVPSHPSLDLLLEVLSSVRQYLVGLPDKCPIFITVDGIQEKYKEGGNKKDDILFLSADKQNREKYDSYIRALYRHFKDDDNVKILVAGKNVGLAENLKRVVENLHPYTKYMYLMQHDLPFAKEINHTAIVKTANEYPEINIVRFNFKRVMGHSCEGVPEINTNGIELRKGMKWSDQNQFARVSHYVNDIFPILGHQTFPELLLKAVSFHNCTYFGPYYYAKGSYGPWYKHTDATERYGAKLADRVKRGELHVSALSHGNLKEMRRAGVNITELF